MEERSNTNFAVSGPQSLTCVVVSPDGPGLFPEVRCRRQCSNSWKVKGEFIASESSCRTNGEMGLACIAAAMSERMRGGIGFGSCVYVPLRRSIQALSCISIVFAILFNVGGTPIQSFMVLEAARWTSEGFL